MAYPFTQDSAAEFPNYSDGAPNIAHASHQNQTRDRIRALEPRVGDLTRGTGSARGWVQATVPAGTNVLVGAIARARLGATRLVKLAGAPYTVAWSDPSGLLAGQKRIDLLTIDTGGNFAWTLGAPTTGTPVAPADPPGKLVLAEVYHRQGTAKITDSDDGANSYLTDARPVMGDVLAGALALAPLRATLAGVLNDYNPAGLDGAAILYLTANTSDWTMTGLAGGLDGRVITLHNLGPFNLTLKNQDAASQAINRFAFGGDIVLGINQGVALNYDGGAVNRWRAATPGAGAPVVLTKLGAVLGGDVTLTAGAWTDVLTLALTAGSWLLFGALQATAGAAQVLSARLGDGVNHYGGAELSAGAAGEARAFSLVSEPIVLAAGTTLRLQGYTQAATTAAVAKAAGAQATKVTRLSALRIG